MFQLQPMDTSQRASLALQGSKPVQEPSRGMFGGNHRAYNADFQPYEVPYALHRQQWNPQDFVSPTFDPNAFLDVTFGAALGGDKVPKASYERFTMEQSTRRPFLAAENNPAGSGRELTNYDNPSAVFLCGMQQLQRHDPRLTTMSSWEVHDYMRKEGIKKMYNEYFQRSSNGIGYSVGYR
jgi:hypothetical protein